MKNFLLETGISTARSFNRSLAVLIAWFLLSYLLLNVISPSAPDAVAQTQGSYSSFAVSVIAVPIVENALFVAILIILEGDKSFSRTVTIASGVAAALHMSWRAIPAFGLFFVIGCFYFRNRLTSPKWAFWGGVLMHGLFNIPASLAMFLNA